MLLMTELKHTAIPDLVHNIKYQISLKPEAQRGHKAEGFIGALLRHHDATTELIIQATGSLLKFLPPAFTNSHIGSQVKRLKRQRHADMLLDIGEAWGDGWQATLGFHTNPPGQKATYTVFRLFDDRVCKSRVGLQILSQKLEHH
jgi:hypothetical protein